METKPQKIRLDFIAGSSFSSSTLVPDKSDKSDKSRERSASPDIRISEASGSGEEEYSCRSSASTEEELRGSDVSKEGAWKDVGEEEEEEEKEKEEKEEKEPKGKGDDDVDVAHSWKEVDHSSFLLRVGPNYQKTGTKAPSPASLYEIVGVDCIQAGNKINDIASKLTIPKDWNDIETNHPHVPSLFVVNMQIPSSFESSLFGSITDGEGWSLVYVNYADMGYVVCFEDYYSILLLSYSISSSALESPELLLSYYIITVALHNTIILIITHLSTLKSTDTGTIFVSRRK